MELSREQTVAEHRKMWKWISRQIMKDYKEQYSIKSIFRYKRIYIENNFKNKYIHSYCFCCNYVYNVHCLFDCIYCPLCWNNENTEKLCTNGYYGSIKQIFDNTTTRLVYEDRNEISEEGARRLSKIAYKIAMLEERKDNV